MKIIQLNKGASTVVDDEDYEYLSKYHWFINNTGYAVRQTEVDGKKRMLYMHRVIMSTPSDMEVDHINFDRLDNRRCNLRNCTPSQNMCNSLLRSTNTSGIKGVSWDKRKRKWHVGITKDRKYYNLGSFADINDAANIYKIKAKELFGEFYND